MAPTTSPRTIANDSILAPRASQCSLEDVFPVELYDGHLIPFLTLNEAVAIATRGTGGMHVSCDVDWIDPGEAPGVGTPVRGGATLREAHLAMEIIHDADALVSMDLVEINPILDRQNHTAELAAELVASAFGRRIL